VNQAAIAIGNARTLDSIQNLLDGLNTTSVKTIKSRNSKTSGNSRRFAILLIAPAKNEGNLKTRRFAEVSFSKDQQARYAILLFCTILAT